MATAKRIPVELKLALRFIREVYREVDERDLRPANIPVKPWARMLLKIDEPVKDVTRFLSTCIFAFHNRMTPDDVTYIENLATKFVETHRPLFAELALIQQREAVKT